MSFTSIYEKTARTCVLPNGHDDPPAPIHALIHELLATSVLLNEDWEALPEPLRQRVLWESNPDKAIALLVQNGLLTDYQADRIEAGTTFGLVLGNYRVLDGSAPAAWAWCSRPSTCDMRRLVAIKVLPLCPDEDPGAPDRFFTEMRAVAQLQHPNIVAAIDAGKAASHDPDQPVLHYFVMEYVAGPGPGGVRPGARPACRRPRRAT